MSNQLGDHEQTRRDRATRELLFAQAEVTRAGIYLEAAIAALREGIVGGEDDEAEQTAAQPASTKTVAEDVVCADCGAPSCAGLSWLPGWAGPRRWLCADCAQAATLEPGEVTPAVPPPQPPLQPAAVTDLEREKRVYAAISPVLMHTLSEVHDLSAGAQRGIRLAVEAAIVAGLRRWHDLEVGR